MLRQTHPSYPMACAVMAVTTCCLLLPNGASAEPDNSWTIAAFAGREAAPASMPAAVRKRPVAITAIGRAPPETIEGAQRAVTTSVASGNGCIPEPLQRALDDVATTFGSVSITSTCRSRSQNAAAGGAPQSFHLSGQAVDFRSSGSASAVLAFLAKHPGVGGLKHYGGGLFHIDTGDRRSF